MQVLFAHLERRCIDELLHICKMCYFADLMLNNITDEIAYQYDEDGDRVNRVEMRIRKK